MAKSTAYFEGQEALIDETSNPYTTGSIEWEEWERGWLDEKPPSRMPLLCWI